MERAKERTFVRDRASDECNEELEQYVKTILVYGQVTKRIRWMPRQLEAMKDVVTCDKPRGVGKQTLIRGFPNGETQPA